MQKSLFVAAAAAMAIAASAPVPASAQAALGRYAATADHHVRSVHHYRPTARFYAARPGDFITNFSSSEHVAVNHPPKNR
jgi:hypothetical protein